MAKYHKLRGYPTYVSRNLARRIAPILRWVEEASPRQKEKLQAKSILRKIYNIEDWRQVLLTKGEIELLSFVRTEFPEGVPPEEGEQLDLFTISPAKEATFGKQKLSAWERQGLTPPSIREEKLIPELKTNLTEEEKRERQKTLEQSNYKPRPESYWNKKIQERKEE